MGGFGAGGGGGGFDMKMFSDPQGWFESKAKGGVLSRDDLNGFEQRMFDRWAQSVGSSNGRLTSDQFKNAVAQAQERMKSMGMGGGFGGMGGGASGGGGMGGFGRRGESSGGPGGPGSFPSRSERGGDRGERPDRGDRGDRGSFTMPGGGFSGGGNWGGGGGGGGFDSDAIAERIFRSLDKDGDGLLKIDDLGERFETLANEREKWDTNNDGMIDLNEFKAYFAARAQQRMNERAAMDPNASSGSTHPDDEPDRRPVVYRAGKLPKDLPDWFAKIDTNQDGQISLAEWRASGRPLEEFRSMDRSGDNLLTIEETLLYVRLHKHDNSAVASTGGNDRPGGMLTGMGAGNSGPGGMAFGDRGGNGGGPRSFDRNSMGAGPGGMSGPGGFRMQGGDRGGMRGGDRNGGGDRGPGSFRGQGGPGGPGGDRGSMRPGGGTRGGGSDRSGSGDNGDDPQGGGKRGRGRG
jgi:Ca2+-binding EF-hand superfamily protein